MRADAAGFTRHRPRSAAPEAHLVDVSALIGREVIEGWATVAHKPPSAPNGTTRVNDDKSRGAITRICSTRPIEGRPSNTPLALFPDLVSNRRNRSLLLRLLALQMSTTAVKWPGVLGGREC